MNMGLRVSEQSNSTLIQENIKNIDFGDGGRGSYSLRDKPKKSCRWDSDSKHSMERSRCDKCGKWLKSLRALKAHMMFHLRKQIEENVCKECGRGFVSMAALFGHMRTHSKKSRVCHDFEALACPIRKKRSNTRYKKITSNPYFSNFNAGSLSNESEEELEVAMSLIMLSEGVKNWVDLKLVTGSSHPNSETFEPQSVDEGINTKEGGNYNVLCTVNASTEKDIAECDTFGSGFDGTDENKIEMRVSIDGLPVDDKGKSSKLGDQHALELDDNDIEKGSIVGLEQHMVIEVNVDQADSEFLESNSIEDPSFDVVHLELMGNSFGKLNYTAADSEILKDSKKEHKYKCRTCDKIFHSYQALGGHRTHHKLISSCSVLKMGKTRVLTDNVADSKAVDKEIAGVLVTSYESMKSKEYECLVCFKVFPSGQALGGHKRTHYNLFSTSKAKETMLIAQALPEIGKHF